MTLAGKNLFIAGPADLADETKMLGYLPAADDPINRELRDQEQAWQGKRGGVLWAMSSVDGADWQPTNWTASPSSTACPPQAADSIFRK